MPPMTPKTREILDRTAHDRAGLLASVDGMSSSQMEYRPSEDAWSAADVLHHLALAHEASAQLMEHFLKRNLTVDHIVPKKNGGTDHPDNLWLLCQACNSSKGTKSQAEFLRERVKRGDGLWISEQRN